MIEKVTIRYEGCPHSYELERPHEPTGIYHKPGCVCVLCCTGTEETREGVCGQCEHQGGYTGRLRTACYNFEQVMGNLLHNFRPVVIDKGLGDFRETYKDTLLTLERALYKMTLRNMLDTIHAEYERNYGVKGEKAEEFARWATRNKASREHLKRSHEEYTKRIRRGEYNLTIVTSTDEQVG